MAFGEGRTTYSCSFLSPPNSPQMQEARSNMRRRTVAALVALACAAGISLVGVSPAVAAKAPDPCKVFKTTEISSAFGVTVGAGTKGLTTPVSTQCTYAVPAGTGRPSGSFVVTLMFVGAKIAYDGLPKVSSLYTTLNENGVKGVYAAPPLSVLNVLKGSTMLGVQGTFLNVTGTTGFVDVKAQLETLAKIGLKRI